MAQINPMQMADVSSRLMNTGRKVVAAVGHKYRSLGQNNYPVVDIQYVCIKDKTDSEDEGAILTDTFWLTERSMWRIAKLSIATGWCKSPKDSFDPEIEEELIPVYVHGAFEIDVVDKDGTDGVTRKEVSRHYPTNSLKLTKEQKEMIKSAETSWVRSLDSIRKNSDSAEFTTSANPHDDAADDDFEEDLPF